MAEFEIGGVSYRTSKMSARDQLHLLRGLGPLFGPMVQMAMTTSEGGMDAVTRQMLFLTPFFEAFAKMEQVDVDTLVNRCLAVTRRRIGENGSQSYGPPLFNMQAGREQFDDIDISGLMKICWEVIQENLGGFFVTGSNPLIGTGPAQPPAESPG